jgi:hypothetical protein
LRKEGRKDGEHFKLSDLLKRKKKKEMRNDE